MHFLYPASAFAVIAVRAGCNHVRPDVLAAHVTGRHMIYRQVAFTLAAVLAGIIVAAENFAARQFDVWARAMNLVPQSDDRGTGQQLSHRSYVTTSIHDHIGFARQEQADRPTRGTNIDRLEIGIQH